MPEPKKSFLFDGQHITELLDYRGSQGLPPRPVSLNCDFCYRLVEWLWCYQCEPFVSEIIPGHTFAFSGGSWNACSTCRPYIDQRDCTGLMAHVLLENSAVEFSMICMFRRTYLKVFAAMNPGPPITWHSGDLFPVVERIQ